MTKTLAFVPLGFWMDGNGQNQWWSSWEIVIHASDEKRPSLAEVRENAARFARARYGSATEMRVSTGPGRYRIQLLSEGHPVHDPACVAVLTRQWQQFVIQGFGMRATVTVDARLVSGRRQDGSAREDLIIAPGIRVCDV